MGTARALAGTSSDHLRAAMPTASLIRVVRLRARHRYGREDRPDAWNEERFGEQRRLHEHDYRFEVTVRGPPDEETGFVVDLPALDALLEEVLGPLRGEELNQMIPEVRDGRMQPSTEALAAWLWGRLEGRLPGRAGLRRIRVWESGELGGEVEG